MWTVTTLFLSNGLCSERPLDNAMHSYHKVTPDLHAEQGLNVHVYRCVCVCVCVCATVTACTSADNTQNSNLTLYTHEPIYTYGICSREDSGLQCTPLTLPVNLRITKHLTGYVHAMAVVPYMTGIAHSHLISLFFWHVT